MDSKSKIVNSSKLNGNTSLERSKAKAKTKINFMKNDNKDQDKNTNPESLSSSSSSPSSSIKEESQNSLPKEHFNNNNDSTSNGESNTATKNNSNNNNHLMTNGIPSYLQISKVDLNLKPPIFSTKSIKNEPNSRNISDTNTNENNSNFNYSSTRSTINTLKTPVIESSDINDNILKNGTRNNSGSTVSRNIFNPIMENPNSKYQNDDRIQNNDKHIHKTIVSNHDNSEWRRKAAEVALKSENISDKINVQSDKINLQSDGNKNDKLISTAVNENDKTRNEFVCDYPGCNKNFSRKMNLNSHIQSTHEKRKPFKCETCSKLFARHSDRRRHEEAQHKLKQGTGFICGGVQKNGDNWGCGKSFKRKDGLTAHWKSQKARKKCLKGLINEREIELKLINSKNFTDSIYWTRPNGSASASSKEA
ncbi:unnamed protein product [[Candida] boidinii]|uniref:Unnamed protein product n=1 Tax=Candida boidinii TaxID=5477 RepID=A0A9W6T195_CANBO|nr:nucleic acid binding protein [[Candida] boidinii]OWB84993.1 nucleic acid binding protein [[Candida] boidinii]GME69125.1 unnamed protein product [[Candida] boidinii]GMF49799.1 unnamed protein product [[Candida] boidinii]GMF98406.1 unnamed protein product [[Candida] boidinii]